jgi:hypothetical protein
MTRRAITWMLAICAPIAIIIVGVAMVRPRAARPAAAAERAVEDEGAAPEPVSDPTAERERRRSSRAAAPGPLPRRYPADPDAPVPAGATPEPVREEARAASRAVFEQRIGSLTTLAEVDGFLAELVEQARVRGVATAAEVQPGLMALRALGAQFPSDEMLRRQAAFSQEMLAIGKKTAQRK